MAIQIVIASSDQKWCNSLAAVLEGEQLKAANADSIEELKELLSSSQVVVAVIDIDLLPINNQVIHELAVKYPGLNFLCISNNRFHPDLKEVMTSKIYACIQKPIDMNELLYFIRSIYKDSGYSIEEK
jgi:DNA-binding NtrC family response regulator